MTDSTGQDAARAPATQEDVRWTRVIRPHRGLFSVPLAEIWAYRDLLLLLVRRDFVALYKQTVLGPIWFIIQPVMMTIAQPTARRVASSTSSTMMPPMIRSGSSFSPNRR